MRTTSENDLRARQTIDEILIENKRLLENQIERSTLNSIVEALNENQKN